MFKFDNRQLTWGVIIIAIAQVVLSILGMIALNVEGGIWNAGFSGTHLIYLIIWIVLLVISIFIGVMLIIQWQSGAFPIMMLVLGICVLVSVLIGFAGIAALVIAILALVLKWY